VQTQKVTGPTRPAINPDHQRTAALLAQTATTSQQTILLSAAKTDNNTTPAGRRGVKAPHTRNYY